MTALSYDFPLYSADAGRRLIDYEETGATGELLIAIEREITFHAASAPARIDRGTVTRDEAKARHWLLEAIAADLQTKARREHLWGLWITGANLEEPTPIAELLAAHCNQRPWTDKVATLRSLVEARRASFGDDVAKGRATEAQARDQLDALEAVHDLYWGDAFAWDGTRDQLRAHSNALLDQLDKKEAA